jgi:hypothetical protein
MVERGPLQPLHTTFLSEDIKGRELLAYLGIDGRIIVKGLFCLKIGTSHIFL